MKIPTPLQRHLVYLLRRRLMHRWREENRAAVEAYNRRVVAQVGVFSDGCRRF